MKLRNTLKFTSFALAASLFVGCASHPVSPTTYTGTPLDLHQIGATEKTEILELRLDPRAVQLTLEDRARIQSFVAAYRHHGHGPLIMSMPEGIANPQMAIQAVSEARQLAWSLGVDYQSIRGDTYAANGRGDAPLILAFRGYDAAPAPCQSLANVDMRANGQNLELPTFGCSVRHNIAMMLADPADILGQRPLDPGDVNRRHDNLGKWREGEPTGATRDDSESGTISDAVSG